MIVQRQSGERFEAYQERVHQEQVLLEAIHHYESVLRPLVLSFRECYSDEDWHWEHGKLSKIVARQMGDTAKLLLDLWGLLPPSSKDDPGADLPF